MTRAGPVARYGDAAALASLRRPVSPRCGDGSGAATVQQGCVWQSSLPVMVAARCSSGQQASRASAQTEAGPMTSRNRTEMAAKRFMSFLATADGQAGVSVPGFGSSKGGWLASLPAIRGDRHHDLHVVAVATGMVDAEKLVLILAEGGAAHVEAVQAVVVREAVDAVAGERVPVGALGR